MDKIELAEKNIYRECYITGNECISSAISKHKI